jgi:hypothetical protein
VVIPARRTKTRTPTSSSAQIAKTPQPHATSSVTSPATSSVTTSTTIGGPGQPGPWPTTGPSEHDHRGHHGHHGRPGPCFRGWYPSGWYQPEWYQLEIALNW